MEHGKGYGFQHLPNAKFAGFQKTDVKQMLSKWSLDGLWVEAFSFLQPFKSYLQDEFIQEFFMSPALSSLSKSIPSPKHEFDLNLEGSRSQAVKFNEVKCGQTTMKIFDKLVTNQSIIRNDIVGTIVQCAPYFDDLESTASQIEVGNNLRKFVLAGLVPHQYQLEIEGIEDHCLTTDDKEEFIVKLFAHLVIGGSLCQYEDTINPYLDITKILYKDFISVEVSPEDGCDAGLRVVSKVFKIHDITNALEDKNVLFSTQHLNNFCYLIVNPQKQTCFILYHCNV